MASTKELELQCKERTVAIGQTQAKAWQVLRGASLSFPTCASIFCHCFPLAAFQGLAEQDMLCWSAPSAEKCQLWGWEANRTAQLPNSIISLINPKKAGVTIFLFQMRAFGSGRYSNSFRNPAKRKMVEAP